MKYLTNLIISLFCLKVISISIDNLSYREKKIKLIYETNIIYRQNNSIYRFSDELLISGDIGDNYLYVTDFKDYCFITNVKSIRTESQCYLSKVDSGWWLHFSSNSAKDFNCGIRCVSWHDSEEVISDWKGSFIKFTGSTNSYKNTLNFYDENNNALLDSVGLCFPNRFSSLQSSSDFCKVYVARNTLGNIWQLSYSSISNSFSCYGYCVKHKTKYKLINYVFTTNNRKQLGPDSYKYCWISELSSMNSGDSCLVAQINGYWEVIVEVNSKTFSCGIICSDWLLKN